MAIPIFQARKVSPKKPFFDSSCVKPFFEMFHKINPHQICVRVYGHPVLEPLDGDVLGTRPPLAGELGALPLLHSAVGGAAGDDGAA